MLATIPDPAPPVFRQIAAGTCELAHLGRASVNFVQIVDFAAGTQHSLDPSYTAADGDVLRGASAGTSKVTGTGVTFSATITFSGGGGRFTNSSGEAHVEGSANLAAGTSHYVLQGQIAYAASDGQAPDSAGARRIYAAAVDRSAHHCEAGRRPGSLDTIIGPWPPRP